MPKIFISYRRADASDAAGRIYDRLVAAFGAQSIFKDVDSIPLGADFSEVIAERLSGCHAVIVVIGRAWLLPAKQGGKPRLHEPGDFVRLEVEYALKKRLLIIPALVGKSVMPGAEKLPKSIQSLAMRNAIPIRPDPDFHRDMDRLIEALKSKFPSQQPPPVPTLPVVTAVSAVPQYAQAPQYPPPPPHYAPMPPPHYAPMPPPHVPPRSKGVKWSLILLAWVFAILVIIGSCISALPSWMR